MKWSGGETNKKKLLSHWYKQLPPPLKQLIALLYPKTLFFKNLNKNLNQIQFGNVCLEDNGLNPSVFLNWNVSTNILFMAAAVIIFLVKYKKSQRQKTHNFEI